MMHRIDLNADLGEGCGDDAAIMAIVTRCNIACGGHAGDQASMSAALALAQQHDVAAGAHPSYPDRANFGRTQMALRGEALRRVLAEQIGALKNTAESLGLSLGHVKPHGALYNFAAKDLESARIIADDSRIDPRRRIARPAGIKTGRRSKGRRPLISWRSFCGSCV